MASSRPAEKDRGQGVSSARVKAKDDGLACSGGVLVLR
jgi:hypothetical protein